MWTHALVAEKKADKKPEEKLSEFPKNAFFRPVRIESMPTEYCISPADFIWLIICAFHERMIQQKIEETMNIKPANSWVPRYDPSLDVTICIPITGETRAGKEVSVRVSES